MEPWKASDPVGSLIRPDWPPLRHVRAGWAALTEEERQVVRDRLEAITPHLPRPSPQQRGPMLHFFAFLAQVETIAIEIPMRFLDHCPEDVRPMLRRQLVDEVFHSTLFARIAHDLAHPGARPPAPLPTAEVLLDQIRAEEDLGITATMLNLVAEGWIETLFRHARRWGIADPVFQTVLEDEARHVHEATDYAVDIDMDRAKAAVEMLEEGLMEVGAEPTVGLAMLHLAGPDAYRLLTKDLHRSHRRHLGEVGMEPGKDWVMAVEGLERMLEAQGMEPPSVVEDTPWMTMARSIWDTPRDPTMQGSFDLRIGHVPKRMLTPVFVAAVGRAWAKHPQFNRVLAQDRIWQLPRVNVGVRVMVADDELATVVITEADKRSPKDIARMLEDGMKQLQALHARRPRGDDAAGREERVLDPELGTWMPPGEAHFSVGVSNVGKFGLEEGAGAFTGAMTPSTDLTIGRRTKKPTWRGVAYLPAWHVPIGALQDHRVFDGRAAGNAMQAIQQEMRPKAVRAILKAPDTIPDDVETPSYDDRWFQALPAELRMMPSVGFTKYLPLAIGGLGLGAGLGIGGYYLFQHLSGASAQAAAAAAGVDLQPVTASGAPRCQAVTNAGTQCSRAAQDGAHVCGQHEG